MPGRKAGTHVVLDDFPARFHTQRKPINGREQHWKGTFLAASHTQEGQF